MDLLKFKKPGWKHADPSVRLAAVQEIDAQDTETLSSLVLNDEDERVRLAALDRIENLEALEKIAQQTHDAYIGNIVRDKLNRLLLGEFFLKINPHKFSFPRSLTFSRAHRIIRSV